MSVSTKKLIEQHQEAKAKLSHYQAEEKKLRLSILDKLFPNAIEGTHSYIHNHHDFKYEIKGTFKINHRINAKYLDLSRLTEAEQECVVMKPSLSLRAYKQLDESERTNLDEAVVATPALPTITISEIKE